ncbi:MAG: Arm DNA-binding domain-containing protein [Geminicoccaceae bacterium]
MRKVAEKRLANLAVKRAGPGCLADSSWLYLLVRKAGSKSWCFRRRDRGQGGKLRMIDLGSIRNVSLADTREKAARLRKAVAGGDNGPTADGA